MVQTDQVKKEESSGFSSAQYSQLLEMFQKHQQYGLSATKQNGDNANPHALLAGNICLMSKQDKDWIIDSGATDHICSNITLLESYNSLIGNDRFIIIPDGRKVQITHIGNVIMDNDIILADVLYVPDFHFNLISVKKLCKDLACKLVFIHDKCYVQNPSMKNQMHVGSLHQGLYHTELKDKDDQILCCTAIEEAQLWHLRMGHIPFSQLKLVQTQCDGKSYYEKFVCQICHAARQTRKSFHSSCIKTKSVFELLHLDIWGPYQTKTSTGCNQFLTVVDDYSRFTWFHLSKTKSEVVSILLKFSVSVETQFNTKIQSIRSDNAKEFCEGALQIFCQQKGILHQGSCAYTPHWRQPGLCLINQNFLLNIGVSAFSVLLT